MSSENKLEVLEERVRSLERAVKEMQTDANLLNVTISTVMFTLNTHSTIMSKMAEEKIAERQKIAANKP